MRRVKITLEKIPKFLLSWFVLDIILLIVWVSGSDPNNKVVALAALTVGLVSFLFYEENRAIINWLTKKKRFVFLKFLFLGLFGATVAEMIFLFWQKALGVQGIAASPNPLFDLAITLPIYFLILSSFWFIQKKKRYPITKVFIIGGIYELLADGLIGGFFEGSIFLGLIYGLIGLPIFMVIYSLVLIPPALFLEKIQP